MGYATDAEREQNAHILQGWIGKRRIDFMQMVRERLALGLRQNGVILGALDLILKEDCKPILFPEMETYQIEGAAWRKDKTKAASFKMEFVGQIGLETDMENVRELVNALMTDILLNMAAEDTNVNVP